MILSVISGCKKDEGNLIVTFINDTPYTIQNLYVQDKKIGNLASGASSKPIKYVKFTFDSRSSTETANCKINDKTIDYDYKSFCFTMYKSFDQGHIYLNINFQESATKMGSLQFTKIN